MKKLLNFFIVAFLLNSCVSEKFLAKDIEGVYVQEHNKNISLTFRRNSFCFSDPRSKHMASFSCCDTITYGEWSLEKNSIALSTPQLNLGKLKLKVEESSNESTDTLYIYIFNPIEDYQKFNDPVYRDIYYKILLKAKKGTYYDRLMPKSIGSNVVKIFKPKNVILEEFSIFIYPTGNFSGRNIGVKEAETYIYKVNTIKNNVFKVTIPQLDYNFMTYLRLNRDFAKIVDRNTIEWDGEFYKKQ